MKILCILHLFIALELLAASALQHKKNYNHDFDLLIFTQSWPQTVCHDWKEKDASHTCNLPSDSSWTIHGIWPTKYHTIGPAFCNKTWHFDPELIRPIENELEQQWMNIQKDTSTYALWTHEWTKHGTCAALLPQLNNERKYFTQGLTWQKKYYMAEILKKAQISPSMDTEYKLNDVYNAVKLSLGKNPAIECRKEGDKSFMSEIRICFDKNLNLHDCDGIKSNGQMHTYDSNGNLEVISNCDINMSILYPDDVPTMSKQERTPTFLVELYKLVKLVQWITL